MREDDTLTGVAPSSSNPQPSSDDVKLHTQLANVWGMDPAIAAAAKQAMLVYRYKHGMFAAAPIICKASDCPYVNVCTADPSHRVLGQRCPVEAGAIMARYEQWCNHFKIEFEGDEIAEGDLVDASLIRDLVENEIQILRAENKIAMNADFIKQAISSVDQRGNVYYEDAVSPEATYKMQLQDKRYKLLNLLNSTRKDKAGAAKQLTPSEEALSIFAKINQNMANIDLDDIIA